MGPLHNKQALLFILLIVCQATIWYMPDFHHDFSLANYLIE